VASDQSFVEFVVNQLDVACAVTYKKMFGEFGLYSQGKMFAVICDDQLFVKPTGGGRAFIGEVVEAPPYPGASRAF
jgi:TfoX/Sxy family transcriptional regulator of competence genes